MWGSVGSSFEMSLGFFIFFIISFIIFHHFFFVLIGGMIAYMGLEDLAELKKTLA